jgi:hypothetical protein
VAFFNDRDGTDRYGSSGPFYNGGVAWDHGVSVMIDTGFDNDRYALADSTGLGRADYSGWALFIDEGGDDLYQLKDGFGHSTEHGVGAHFDLNGRDTYDVRQLAGTQAGHRPSNGKAIVYPDGGLFVDR